METPNTPLLVTKFLRIVTLPNGYLHSSAANNLSAASPLVKYRGKKHLFGRHGGHSRFLTCSDPNTSAPTAMQERMAMWRVNSGQPPPRRMTLREASIIQVV